MKTQNKIFWTLFILSLLSAILVLPYALTIESSILSAAPVPMPVIILASIIQSSVLFAIAVFFGIMLSRKIGFSLPLLESWFEKKRISYAQTLMVSILTGLGVGISIFLLDRLVFVHFPAAALPPAWMGLLASFYGGIGEEVLMRFFLMSLLIFILMIIARRKRPNRIIIWSSIVFIAVVFGLGHLPATSALTPITPIIVLRAITLNGIGGVVFGWLYWKRGLESAIISHFFADLILHVLTPLFGM